MSVLAEWGVEALQVGAGETVLAIGSGAGAGLVPLARAGAGRVIGIDPAEALLGEVGRQVASEGLDHVIELVEAAAGRLPLPDASIDAILAVNAAGFWTDPAAGFEEARRVLRPGGRIVTVLQPESARTPDEFERAACAEHERLLAAGFDALPPLVKVLDPVDACLIAGSVCAPIVREPASGLAPARAGCTS